MSPSPRPPRFQPPETCPICGEEVPPRALACPECGADENSGWREDGEDEESFDYDEFVEREFKAGRPRRSLHPLWIVTAIILLAAFFWWMAGW